MLDHPAHHHSTIRAAQHIFENQIVVIIEYFSSNEDRKFQALYQLLEHSSPAHAWAEHHYSLQLPNNSVI
jgi:hypothetical protein